MPLVFLLSVPIGLLALGFVYQAAGLAADRKRRPPRGEMIRCGDVALHLHRQGRGTPVVVLEAGVAATSLGWGMVQSEIAEFTTVYSYDRAGLGWSESTRRPRTVEQMNGELHTLLEAAGVPPPYILVGHSFGGLLVRAFAARYPNLTSALILVDPVSVDAWLNCSEQDRKRLDRGVRLALRGALLARFGVVRAALKLLMSGSRILPKLIGRAAAPGASGFMERLLGQIRRLPQDLWPDIQAHWSDEKCFRAMAGYLRALPGCAQEVERSEPPASIPQTILSAATATESELLERDRWVDGRTHSRHIRVPETGHWIQLDQPAVVVNAVREAVLMFRRSPVI